MVEGLRYTAGRPGRSGTGHSIAGVELVHDDFFGGLVQTFVLVVAIGLGLTVLAVRRKSELNQSAHARPTCCRPWSRG